MKTKTKILSRIAFFVSMMVSVAFGQGYFQNFTAPGVPSAITAEASYALSVQNQELRILVNKGNLFHGITFSFPSALNLSSTARRKVSFRIKTDTATRVLPFEVGVSFFNAGGNNQQGGRRTNKLIYPTGNWQTITFDFNDPAFTTGTTPLNFSAVTQMNIVIQPQNYMQGTLFIDDVAVGNNGVPGQAAIAAPYFLGIPNQQVPVNTSFTYRIQNAVDADNLNSDITFTAASSNPSILPNPTFTNSPFLSNNYFAFTSGNGSTGDLRSSRMVNMVMTPATNQFGMVTVTVTATAASQIAGVTSVPHRYVFTVDVRRNIAPTIGVIPTSLTIGSDRRTDILFDDIFSGNGEANQIMTITGLSSDQSVLQNAQIVTSFNGIALSGRMSITPIQFSSPASKTFNLTVNIADNGGVVAGGSDQTNYVIPVTVLPTFFNPPTIAVIPNQIDNIITQGPRTIRIEPITDGNGGSRISSIVAVSGNTGILANPTVSYTTGNNFALLTYNSQVVGTTNISVTATNFGAPANSNGNSSFTRVFVMTALNPALAGYIEPMTVTTTVGAPENTGPQADGRSSTVAGTWYIEARNTIQTVSINSVTGTFTNVMAKPGTAPTGYFSGVWYKPFGGGSTFDFATYPYLSVELSAVSGTPSSIAIDLWDVNGIRYGLTSAVPVNGTLTRYTFCYTGTPSPGFDFSKVKTILFNFGVTAYNNGTGSWEPFNGTVTMRDLRIGSVALGSGSCALPVPAVVIGDAPNPFHLTSQSGTKTVTISGINAGSTPITGKNNNPVSLSVNGGFSPSVLSFNATTGVAVIQYTTGGGATSDVINVVGNATGSTQTTRTFTVTVQAAPASQNIIVTNDLNANFSDGNRGQTIDGSPFGICEIWGPDGGSNQPDSYYEMLKDVGMKSMRIGIWDFEPKNDNNNPFVLDKTKLDYTAMGVDFFKKAHDAGVERFFVTFFSPPSFTKYNKEYGVPNAPFTLAPGFVITNTVDSAYYEEYAEYAVAFVQGIKEKTGVDIYGICLGNEIQFNQTYQSVVFNTTQYVDLVKRVGRRLAAAGLKTFLWGAETLQAQDSGNNYLKAIQNDLEARNYFSGYAIHAYASNGVGQAAPSWGNVVLDSRNALSNPGLTLLRQNPIATVGPGGEPHNGNGGIGIPIYQTETSQGGVATVAEWSNALGIFGGVSTSVSNGKNSGWYYIGITKDYKMYYTYKHIDKFVFGGARHIPSNQPSGTNVNAFRNPDNSVCVILANDNSMKTFSFGGVNMPAVNRAYLSVDNLFWRDLGTVTGSITVPPNALLTLWGGGNALVAASSVTPVAAGGVTAVNIAGGNLQFSATVAPSNLVDKSVVWSVINGTGAGTISPAGIFTASSNGTVTVRATSVATPTVFGEVVLNISGQYVRVSGLVVSGAGGNTINTSGGTRQINATYSPALATNTTTGWALVPSVGIASINSSGLLTAISNGLVTVIGTSVDNNTVTGRVVITISGQSILVTSATVAGAGGINTIAVSGGTLNMTYSYGPSNANTNTLPGWTILPVSGIASINAVTGVLTATGNGLLTVTGTFGSVFARREIVVSNQFIPIPVTSATINGTPNNFISTANGSITMNSVYLPSDANTNTVLGWTANIPAGIATFNSSTRVLTAVNNGNGVVTITGNYGLVTAVRLITISGQFVVTPVSSATITGTGLSGPNRITLAGGNLTMGGLFSPSNANTNTLVGWTANIPNSIATFVNATGVLTAANNGNGVVTITGTYGAVTAIRLITISGQFVIIPVVTTTVNGVGGVSVINTAGGTLQMVAGFLPANANTGTAAGTWLLNDPSGQNSINATTGLLQSNANGNGTVTVTGSFGAIAGTRVVIISGQNIPVTSAVINGNGTSGPNRITIAGASIAMSGVVTPANANTNTLVGWSITDPAGNATNWNAANGTFNALRDGTVTITGTYGAVNATRIITISGQPTAIAVTGTNTIAVNLGTSQMTANYTPSASNVLGTNWAVLGGSGTISGTGLLQALTDGVVTVTATSIQNPAIVGRLTVTITNQLASVVPVTSLALAGNNAITTQGGQTTITSTVLPANATNKTISWTVTPSSGVVNFTPGSFAITLTATGNGIVTILGTSSNPTVTDRRVVTVTGYPIPVLSAVINGTGSSGTNIISNGGGNLTMTGVFSPSNANTNTVVGWSAIIPSGVASFAAGTGILTASNNGNGIVTITGSYGSVSVIRLITITGQFVAVPVTSGNIVATPTAITAASGTATIAASFLPANANTGTVLGLTANIPSGIATYSAGTGVLTALNQGNGVVTFTGTYNGGATVFTRLVTISGQFVGIPVTSVTIGGTSGLNVINTSAGTLQMIGGYLPANANTGLATFSWSLADLTGKNSINPTTGLLQAAADGNGVVTVTGTYGPFSTTRTITISNQFTTVPVVSATVGGAGGVSIINTAGGTLQMTSGFLPANANTGTSITWSKFDPLNIASFNPSTGLITANNDGNGFITITGIYGGTVSAISVIELRGQYIAVTGITVSGAGNVQAINSQGGTLQLLTAFSPVSPSSTSVVWTRNTNIASLPDANGFITAVSDGVIEFTATATNPNNTQFSSTITITVTNQALALTSMSISGTNGQNVISVLGEVLQMTPTFNPANTSQTSITWTSSNPAIASIGASTGTLTPLDNGVVTITAVSNDVSSVTSSFVITVSNQTNPLTGIRITGNTNILVNSVNNYSAVFTPLNTTFRNVQWSCSPSRLARITNLGELTALTASGVITISITSVDDPLISSFLVVTILGGSQGVLATSVSIRTTSNVYSVLGLTNTLSFTGTVLPANTTDKTILWSVSPFNSATITGNGLFIPLQTGIVSVTGRMATNSAIFSTKVVNVIEVPEVSITGVNDSALAEDGIDIYPNPTDDEVIVSFHYAADRVGKLVDVSGNIIIDRLSFAEKKSTISFSNLKSGVYYLIITNHKGTYTKKIVYN